MSTASSTRDMRWLMLVIAAIIVFLDRVTKFWIVSHIKSGQAMLSLGTSGVYFAVSDGFVSTRFGPAALPVSSFGGGA